MTKQEMVQLFKELNVPISESTPRDNDMEEEFRLHYWDYYWEDNMASGEDYSTIVTYQISVTANKPRHPKLMELKKKLNDRGLHPCIQHEYNADKRRVHSFFALDVLENLMSEEEKNE